VIRGGAGNDELFGDSSAESGIGGTGNDFIDGGSGTDSADGGPGFDTCVNVENPVNCEA
jgi:Ca2+-binding RTX toxin-like protein